MSTKGKGTTKPKRHISILLYLKDYDLTGASNQTIPTPAAFHPDDDPYRVHIEPTMAHAGQPSLEPEDLFQQNQEPFEEAAALLTNLENLKLQNRDLEFKAKENDYRLE